MCDILTHLFLVYISKFYHAEIISNRSSCKHESIVCSWQKNIFDFYKLKIQPNNSKKKPKPSDFSPGWAPLGKDNSVSFLKKCVVQSDSFPINLQGFINFDIHEKSLKESKPIFQLITFSGSGKNHRWIIFHLINGWWSSSGVGSKKLPGLGLEKDLPLLPPTERIYCFLSSLMPCICKKPFSQE